MSDTQISRYVTMAPRWGVGWLPPVPPRPIPTPAPLGWFAMVIEQIIQEAYADAESYSYGSADPTWGTDVLADSISESTGDIVALTAAVQAAADSRSFVSIATDESTGVTADADSYSFGVADPNTESLADSYSEGVAIAALSQDVTAVAGSISFVTADSLYGSTDAVTASADSRSTPTVASATTMSFIVTAIADSVSDVFDVVSNIELGGVTADADSYSLGVADPATDSLADSYSEGVANVSSIEVSVLAEATSTSLFLNTTTSQAAGTTNAIADSISGVSATSVNVVNWTVGTEIAESESTPSVTATNQVVVAVTAPADSRSTALTTGTVDVVGLRADADSYSLGVADPATDTLADSYSEGTATVSFEQAVTAFAASLSGALNTSSGTASTGTSTVTGTAGSHSYIEPFQTDVVVAWTVTATAASVSNALLDSGATSQAAVTATADSVSGVSATSVTTMTASVTATADSRSNALATSTADIGVRADADSYSLGVADPETDTQADSYSEGSAQITIEAAVTARADSRSSAILTNTTVVAAAVNATALSESFALVTSSGAAVVAPIAVTATAASTSTPVVTASGGYAIALTATAASQSSALTTGSAVVQWSITATAASTSTPVVQLNSSSAVMPPVSVTATVQSTSTPQVAYTEPLLIASFTVTAQFEVDPEMGGSYDSTVQADVDRTLAIPWWCSKVDALAVGGGGGSSGSNPIARGNGGNGGKWGWNEYGLATLTGGAAVDGFTAVLTIGNGGTGGPAGTALGGLVKGNDGGASTVVIRSMVGSTPTNRATTTGAGGAGGSGGVASGGAAGQDGGPVTNGNATSGRDVSLNPPYININGVPATLYSGGGTQTTAGAVGLQPGGGGAGKNAGSNVGSGGANGRAFLRMYSINRVTQNQSWTTPGTYTLTLPPSTETVTPMALGGGGGGAGGTVTVIGAGGRGGQWGRLATQTSVWTVDQLLSAKGLSRGQISRLFVQVTVGRGGTGGAALNLLNPGNSGNPGESSSMALMCTRTTGGDVELARVTGGGGAAGQSGGAAAGGGRQGKAATGGNTNIDGNTSYPDRDMRVYVNSKNFPYRGGSENPGNNLQGDGYAPGGGGCGGGIAVLAIPGILAAAQPRDGYTGANGVAHVVYSFLQSTKESRPSQVGDWIDLTGLDFGEIDVMVDKPEEGIEE